MRDKIKVGCFAYMQDFHGGKSHMAKIVRFQNDEIFFNCTINQVMIKMF